MSRCLIGYTGFVGQTLLKQTTFDSLFNSKNISDIKGKNFDLIVCAGASAVKWKANQNPEEDLRNINSLIENLKEVETKKFILISTVDVYKNPILVDEDTVIEPGEIDPYGRHRFYLEQFAREHCKDTLTIRLPGLFGTGLKKNFIYDLLNNNCLHLTHYESAFQFYNLKNLWKDIQIALENNLEIVNFATEPVTAKEVALNCFGVDFSNVTEKPSVYYDMRSKFSNLFGEDLNYMCSKQHVLEQIKQFVAEQKRVE
ncbi:NAD-dependent epimerase/dehydratase family protein [Effusibacillus dendaii]|uniref:NAD-dependent epimerase/dehydratase domain-containing protein n=1 Tax=Effusibacillus dendaii TaxID=2743772 RepID=A0A7I8DIX9_9BACL|nr:NAD-dependent epimerase/dehydratase family protein [Effusibacillus dendaii]BCJ87791.1 hypothetical protein skT53_27760 [Effusibacillus dendaii]